MPSIRNFRLFLVLLCVLCGHINLAFSDKLPAQVSKLVSKYGIPPDAISIDVRDLSSDNSILRVNSDKPRNPASVIKLLTTLSALELLGPDYVWNTRYYIHGKLAGDVIQGDLVIRGDGDPFLTVDRLWHHILSIRERGIRAISGSLVIDNSLFDIPPHNRSAFDEQPARLYNVGPDAALANFSATRFVFHPINDHISVFADPPLADMVVINKIKPADGKCKSKNSGWNYDIKRTGEKLYATFSGTFRIRCGQHSISRALFSNNEYTFRLFKYLWRQSGGIFDGGYRIARVPENAKILITYPSVPLADIITSINKYSNNVMTRNLFLTLDSQVENHPATLDGARIMLSKWLTANNLSMPELYVDNGSGLSRKTRISSRSLSDLLRHGWNSNYHPEFLSSLSLSALDGTMRKRLHDSGLQGRARIKTGLINGVRSMAGYVNARNNRQYSVAMMIESSRVNYWNGNEIQDAVLKWIYNRK
jgi:D-alanyl-D-alanine carboxypeptidase/D-alanyl-D-alanine-endopeptidase (penicillin-binding protein 4)